jgi:hypothetical protein
MKILYTLMLLVCSMAVVAQTKTNKSRTSQRISDDGKTMHVSITGDANSKVINYDKVFNIANLSQAEKDALKQRIADSLGIGIAQSSVKMPAMPRMPAMPEMPSIPAVQSLSSSSAYKRTTATSAYQSKVYEDRYDTMHVYVSGHQGQKIFKYSSKVYVKGMSKAQKDAIVKNITDSLGINAAQVPPSVQ